MFSSICWAGVASNPFLRPGSNRPPPVVQPPPPPPKPVVNPAFAKEVEFRGYFLLKGIPYFCVFNKKANFGEWIKLTEKTHEEFQAQAFDLESETLTLAFNGQDFTLTLEQSKNSQGLPNSSPGLPKVNLPPRVSSATNQKVMPPKPKTAPKLPDWLASRVSSRSSSLTRGSSGLSSSTSPGVSSSISSRFTPPPRSSSTVSNNIGTSPSLSQPSNLQTNRSSALNPTGGSNPSVNSSDNLGMGNPVSTPTIQTNPPTPNSQEGNEQYVDEQGELDDLPPPPPPPNILPPSPPPDILPSLDE